MDTERRNRNAKLFAYLAEHFPDEENFDASRIMYAARIDAAKDPTKVDIIFEALDAAGLAPKRLKRIPELTQASWQRLRAYLHQL